MKTVNKKVTQATLKRNNALSIFNNAKDTLKEANDLLVQAQEESLKAIDFHTGMITQYKESSDLIGEDMTSNAKIIENIGKVLDE